MQVRNDLYKLLGIPDFSSLDDIKKAYKSLALKIHPDRVPEDEKEKATENMKDLNNIYEFLSKNKEMYDYVLQASRQPRRATIVVSFGYTNGSNSTGAGSWYNTNFYQ